MSLASPPPLLRCSVCETSLDPNGTCPRCRAPEDWNDRIEALDFVVRRLNDWHKSGLLTDRQQTVLTEHYDRLRATMTAASAAREKCPPSNRFPPRDECWSCHEYLYTNSSHCGQCGAPVTHPAVRSLRYYRHLYRELQAHEEAGGLTLRQSHEMLADTQERIAALKNRLERERAPLVLPVEPEPMPSRPRRSRDEDRATTDEEPSRSFIEVLLDPQTIQWLLLAGGGLIVIGVIIWLASLGLFDNPGFIAALLGAGNAALLGAGYALILKTRFQHAGRALTLLACLVMPLNLWFYHTHNLLTLQNHLWVAALVCCVIYAASAYLLKDGLFVYVLVAGVTLTGLLLLAQYNRFGEIAAPVTLLVVLGLVSLHAERAFAPDRDSPFSRRHFGMPFFWSAQFLFAVGLLLLLGAQVLGWLHEPIRGIFRHFEQPDVSKREFLPWTLALVLAGTYAYLYSDLVVRRVGVYLYLAAITLFWAEIHVLALTDVGHQETIVIITLALTSLAVNLLQVQFASSQNVLRVVSPIGVLLSIVPVLFGVLLHFRAVNFLLNREWQVVNDAGMRVPFEITWGLALAMAVVAVSCRVSAHLFRRLLPEVSVLYFFLTGAATLVFAAELVWLLGVKPWEQEAPLVMLVPIAYLVAAYLYRGRTPERPLVWVGHTATALMIVITLWTTLRITPQVVEPVQGEMRNLLFALFCLEVAIFYGFASFVTRSNWTMYLSAVMLCGAIWQLLIYFRTPDEYYTVAFALTGFLFLIVYRVGMFEKLAMPGLERALFQSANALTTLGFVAGALLSLSRLFLNEFELARLDGLQRDMAVGDWHNPIRTLLYLLLFLSAISVLSAVIVQHSAWRRVHLVLTVVNGVLLFLVIHRLSVLSPWQKLEIFSIVVGVILLALGHFGWYRETERASDLVSFALLLGALCVVMPLLIATIAWRVQHIHQPGLDDLGIIFSCVLLFASGVLCRIKATTLVGLLGMVGYLVVVIISLHRHLENAWIVGIYLTFGGALLFGTGIVLSIYRDRLLTLPDRIKRREGVFRFMDWR